MIFNDRTHVSNSFNCFSCNSWHRLCCLWSIVVIVVVVVVVACCWCCCCFTSLSTWWNRETMARLSCNERAQSGESLLPKLPMVAAAWIKMSTLVFDWFNSWQTLCCKKTVKNGEKISFLSVFFRLKAFERKIIVWYVHWDGTHLCKQEFLSPVANDGILETTNGSQLNHMLLFAVVVVVLGWEVVQQGLITDGGSDVICQCHCAVCRWHQKNEEWSRDCCCLFKKFCLFVFDFFRSIFDLNTPGRSFFQCCYSWGLLRKIEAAELESKTRKLVQSLFVSREEPKTKTQRAHLPRHANILISEGILHRDRQRT